MMKTLVAAITAMTMTAGAAMAQQATPTIGSGQGQPNDNAASIAKERATRNSAGGDREKGAFGEAQSGFVKEVRPYGQWLQDNGWTGSSRDD